MIHSILDLIYPRSCYICKRSLAETQNLFLCFSCWRGLPLIKDSLCFRCGIGLGKGVESRLGCLHCKNEQYHFHEVRAAGRYEGGLKELILDFKFKKMEELQHPLGALIHWQLKRHPFPVNPDVIIPVPLWPPSERKRGYNQAALLANVLASRLNIPCWPQALKKNRQTSPQSELDKTQRKQNLVGTFTVDASIEKNLAKKAVLLVDDIVTTGSTANECSLVLRKAKAKKVYVAAIARTIME